MCCFEFIEDCVDIYNFATSPDFQKFAKVNDVKFPTTQQIKYNLRNTNDIMGYMKKLCDKVKIHIDDFREYNVDPMDIDRMDDTWIKFNMDNPENEKIKELLATKLVNSSINDIKKLANLYKIKYTEKNSYDKVMDKIFATKL